MKLSFRPSPTSTIETGCHLESRNPEDKLTIRRQQAFRGHCNVRSQESSHDGGLRGNNKRMAHGAYNNSMVMRPIGKGKAPTANEHSRAGRPRQVHAKLLESVLQLLQPILPLALVRIRLACAEGIFVLAPRATRGFCPARMRKNLCPRLSRCRPLSASTCSTAEGIEWKRWTLHAMDRETKIARNVVAVKRSISTELRFCRWQDRDRTQNHCDISVVPRNTQRDGSHGLCRTGQALRNEVTSIEACGAQQPTSIPNSKATKT